MQTNWKKVNTFKQLGNILSMFRQTSNKTQSELSESLGLTSAQFISNIERGKITALSGPAFQAYVRLCNVPQKNFFETICNIERNKLEYKYMG